jgi:hypothetical protein
MHLTEEYPHAAAPAAHAIGSKSKIFSTPEVDGNFAITTFKLP